MVFQNITLNDFHDFAVYLSLGYICVFLSIMLDSFVNMVVTSRICFSHVLDFAKDEIKFFICLVGVTLVDLVLVFHFSKPYGTLFISFFVTITRWVHLFRIVLPVETSTKLTNLILSFLPKNVVSNIVKQIMKNENESK